MGCDENQCNTESSCQDNTKCSSGCEMTDMLMKLADNSWEELMKEKMKKVLETKIGKRMDKTAGVIVQASLDYWQHKMQGKAKCEEHKQKIKAAFM